MAAFIPRAKPANNAYTRVGAGQYRGSDGRIYTQQQRDQRLRQSRTATQPTSAVTKPIEATTTTEEAPAVAQPPQADVPSAAPQQQQSAYRTYRDFMPANITSSPEYQWRLQQSQRGLDAKLASMGLSSSGAAVAKELGMINELTGEEIDRQTRLAGDEANRFERVQENQAMRNERSEKSQYDRMMNLMELMSRQNPLEQAYSAAGRIGDSYVNQGNYAANVARDQYGRVIGGGGTMAPVYTPPFASGPDYSEANKYRIGADDATRSGYIDSGSRILGTIARLFGGGGF
jgi:hypothetical protein